MLRRISGRLTYANVVATAALFIALGGTAAASFIVSSNSQIGPDTVSGAKPPSGDGANIIAGSIFTTDLANSAVTNAKLANNTVTTGKVQDGSLTGADLASDTVTGTQIDESTLATVPSATNSAELGGLPPSSYQVAITGSCSFGSGVASFNTAGAVGCNRDSVRPGVASLNLGGISLTHNSCAKLEIPLGGIAVGDTAIMVPDAATWPAGLIYQTLRADQASKIPIEVCNPTGATKSSSTTPISVWEVKVTP